MRTPTDSRVRLADEAQPDPRWRVHLQGKQCRRGHGEKRCTATAVAELNRATIPDAAPVWWAYCPDHLYGRWIRAGVVMRPLRNWEVPDA